MSVQMQQFRVAGVDRGTGRDVSVVIDAATKAAAEVKAEQMNIETTHIVRLKQDEPTPPTEHELFSTEAAEALSGKRTDKLIEEVVPPEEPKIAADPAPPAPTAKPEPNPVIAAITRPTAGQPGARRDPVGGEVSGGRAFALVLLVLLGITAGAYFVLVHEPNNVAAQEDELRFGEDLFSDVIHPPARTADGAQVRDAFGARRSATPDGPPIAPDQQLVVKKPGTPDLTKPARDAGRLVLQSVVTTNGGRFAMINDKLYKPGQAVAGATLVSIANDWVLMEREGKQFTLEIEAGDE